MIPRRRTILVCPFCGSHHQESESGEHGKDCLSNPDLRGCVTCRMNKQGKCRLGLVPVDFVRKQAGARNCSAWRPKE